MPNGGGCRRSGKLPDGKLAKERSPPASARPERVNAHGRANPERIGDALMATTSLHVLPTPGKKGSKQQAPRQSAARRLQQWVAVGCAVVAMTLLALSLAHLGSGIMAITNCHPVEAFALAIGIDLGLVAAEAALLV